jgi:hypothetical protein
VIRQMWSRSFLRLTSTSLNLNKAEIRAVSQLLQRSGFNSVGKFHRLVLPISSRSLHTSPVQAVRKSSSNQDQDDKDDKDGEF